MIIRQATIEDNEEISCLLKQICALHQKERPDYFKENSKKYSEYEFYNIIKDNNRPVFVAVVENKILGYCFCIIKYISHPVLNDHKTLYIDDFCVDETCRRQGLGQKLFEKALWYAKQINARYIELNVWDFNESAIKFYEQCGFRTRSRKMEFLIEN